MIPTDDEEYLAFPLHEFEKDLKTHAPLYIRVDNLKSTLAEIIWHIFILSNPTYTRTNEGVYHQQCGPHKNRSREDLFLCLKVRFPLMTFAFCDGILLHLLAKEYVSGNWVCSDIKRKIYYSRKVRTNKEFPEFEEIIKQYRRDNPWKKK